MIQLKEINKDILNLFLLLLMITTIFNIGIIALNNSAQNHTNQQNATNTIFANSKTSQNLPAKQALSARPKNMDSQPNLLTSAVVKSVKTSATGKPTSSSRTESVSTNQNYQTTNNAGFFTTNNINSIKSVTNLTSGIIINGNPQLASNANSGNGTSTNPYIIENLSASLAIQYSIISIQNTNAYFILRNSNLTLITSTVSYNAISLNNVTNGIIENNRINSDYGINGYYINNSIFSNNYITNTSLGFYSEYSYNNIVTGNQVTCSNSTATIGIDFYKGGNNTFSNNNIISNGASVGYGIYIDTNNNSTISYNNVTGSNSVTSYGIDLHNSNSSSLISNNVTTSDYGYYLYYSNFTTIRNDFIMCNKSNSAGFYLYYSNSSIFINNIENNAYDAFHMEYSFNNTFNSNNAINNTNGFYLYKSSSNNINNNTAKGNTGNDFSLNYSNSNNVTDNILDSNAWGFNIFYSNKTIMSNNSISNENYGLYINGLSNSNIFANNTLQSNTIPIYIDYTSNPVAPANNQILTNTINGYTTLNSILLQSPTNGSTYNNYVTLQYYADLFSSYSSPPTTQSLTIYTNGVANTTALPSGSVINNLKAGQYNISLEAIDGYGNIQTQQANFTIIVAIIPSISISSPTNTSYTSSNIMVNFTATGANLSTVLIYINGVANNSVITSGNTIFFKNGYYNLTIYAVNTVGNSNAMSVYFTVNVQTNTPPATTTPSVTSQTSTSITQTISSKSQLKSTTTITGPGFELFSIVLFMFLIVPIYLRRRNKKT